LSCALDYFSILVLASEDSWRMKQANSVTSKHSTVDPESIIRQFLLHAN
jgi:hypothetical protein